MDIFDKEFLQKKMNNKDISQRTCPNIPEDAVKQYGDLIALW